jgi:RNA polymerase sigma factor (sigma-70 family)
MIQTSTDAELIGAVRVGDEAAYEELYRRHSTAALRFARSLTASKYDAQDSVHEAFARVLAALKAGGGPDEAFRPYLLIATRNVLIHLTRPNRREWTVDDVGPYERRVPFVDPVLASEERRLIAKAFGELPERWRVVLWHTAVEGERPAKVAPLLGISAGAVAALAYRAREGLRERYLQAHLTMTADETCRSTVDRLAAYTRHKLSKTETVQIRAHLKHCAACAVLFGELSDVMPAWAPSSARSSWAPARRPTSRPRRSAGGSERPLLSVGRFTTSSIGGKSRSEPVP